MFQDLKNAKKTDDLTIFFALLGSSHVKAVHMLVISTLYSQFVFIFILLVGTYKKICLYNVVEIDFRNTIALHGTFQTSLANLQQSAIGFPQATLKMQ